jgi:hypothetical protein
MILLIRQLAFKRPNCQTLVQFIFLTVSASLNRPRQFLFALPNFKIGSRNEKTKLGTGFPTVSAQPIS